MQPLSKQECSAGQVSIFLKGFLLFCQRVVSKNQEAKSVFHWVRDLNRLAHCSSFFFPFYRGNAPKLNFGGTSTTQATGITGGFGFGTSAPTSVPSSQAAAPSGFMFGTAATTTTTTTAAQPGTTGGFTFSSGTTTQAGTTGFNIGATSTAAPQAAPTGLTFGAAPAAAATTTASLGSTTQPAATPFSLGGQSSGEYPSLLMPFY